MRHVVFFWLSTALLAGVAWGNGDVVRHDPNSGVILPAGPTAVRVEHETLKIEFQAWEYDPKVVHAVEVHARYWLHNPTDELIHLDIGFPVPGGSVSVVGPPVRVDGRLAEWDLLSYEDLFEPLRPELLRAMKRWAERHPRVGQLAAEMRAVASKPMNYEERRRKTEPLWQQLRPELVKAGVPSPGRYDYHVFYSAGEASKGYKHRGVLRRALLLSGQRHLLPEGRWYVDPTPLDPATGRPEAHGEGRDYSRDVQMLTFSLHLQPHGRHRLDVAYRQRPRKDEEGEVFQFAYVLKTARAWGSFGPIKATVKAPPGLVFRSLPALRYAGMSKGQKVYRGVISKPTRNLQVALAHPSRLWPRLKVNGQVWGRHDMLVGGVPTVPASALGRAPLGLNEKRWEAGEAVLRRGGITLKARPGDRRVSVNGKPVEVSARVVVREGRTYLPPEAVQALFPGSDITLSYHAPSHTVLLTAKPKPKPPEKAESASAR